MCKELKPALEKIFANGKVRPVLLDIGASECVPAVWDPIAKYSTYLGFDPDQRELNEVEDGRFARTIMINEAITEDSETNEIKFYLTKSPLCSSTLPPDTKSLENYQFADKFVVEKEESVHATTLDRIIDKLGLESIHWFKTDSQGIDLRLFQSLRDDIRNQVLAVDIEPGLVDAYQGEDLFIHAHPSFLQQGFWPSRIDVRGTIRMRRSTINRLVREFPELTERKINHRVRFSPVWCETRYLRTLDWLEETDAGSQQYMLLWVFALVDHQYGFALDVAMEYRRRFADDDMTETLYSVPLGHLLAAESIERRRIRTIAAAFLPSVVKRHLKRFISYLN